MSPLAVACVAVGCIFGGALLGMALRRRLPSDQLGGDATDAVKLSAGMISLMAALVLGLLVSSAKSNFDATSEAVTQGGARVILLDRLLAGYGAESNGVRQELRRAVSAGVQALRPPTGRASLAELERPPAMETLLDELRTLKPQTDAQRALLAQADQLVDDILLSRWVQIEQAQTELPKALLEILLFWLTVLYTSFGLIAPRNATVVAVMFLGALSSATAIFLILEMNDPMGGAIRISTAPIEKALEILGR